MSKYRSFPLLLVSLLTFACAAPRGDLPAADGAIRVVATTGLVADAARRVAGPEAIVTALMGPGVDPHLYKASESDVRRLSEADLVLYNGLHLEGKMGDILVKMARSRPVVAVSERLPEERLREPPEFLGQYDPHVWFDAGLWSETLAPIAEALSDLAPAHRGEFESRAAAYREELLSLDAWIETRIAEIPAAQRVLVTAHDAFGYFGERYGMDVIGLQGISTLAEAGLSDVERVVSTVADRKIKAIFVETSVPRRSIEAVQAACRARGHEVAIGGQLFSDALGADGTPEGDYLGMVRYNVNTIVDALR
jgi:manganese/zinc/iron transport system substrate-binding protein